MLFINFRILLACRHFGYTVFCDVVSHIRVLLCFAIFWTLGGVMTASVVWWSEFLATDQEVPGSIPGRTRFSEK
jgi:hypothetical protein